MIAAAALVLYETRGHSLFADEWVFFLYRSHGPLETLLAPNNGSLMLVPILVYRTVFKFLGPDITVFRLILVALELLCAGLFFQLTRRRVGDWIALGAVTLLLFLGSSWLLVSSVAITLYLALALGLAALLAIERKDLRGDVLACVLLVLAVASYSVTLSFSVGVVIAICLRPAPLRLRRAWVVAIPLALYGIWRIWADDYAQHPKLPLAQTVIEPEAIVTKAPAFISKGFAAGLASATGLFKLGPQQPFFVDHSLGVPLAVLLLVAALARFLWPQRPPIDRASWVFLAIPVVFWTSLAVASLRLGGVVASRNLNAAGYQYTSVLLVLLAAAALARGVRIPRLARLALAAVLLASLVANVLTLREAARVFRANGIIDRAELAAVELVGSRAPRVPIETPVNKPESKVFLDLQMPPQDYLPVAAVRGSAAAPASSLRSTTPAARRAADLTLIRLYELARLPSRGVTPRGSSAQAPSLERGAADLRPSTGGCLDVRPRTAPTPLSFKVPLGGLALEADKGPSVALSLRRFADPPGLPTGRLAGGTRATLRIPTDASGQPWRLLISPSQAVRLCGLPTPPAPRTHGTR